MDPVHFTAASKLPKSDRQSDVQTFYDDHAYDPFRTARHIAAGFAGLLRKTSKRNSPKRGFAVLHPAE